MRSHVRAQTKYTAQRMSFFATYATSTRQIFSTITRTRPSPPHRQNQFGVAAGGPIRKDRNFYFFNYEGLRTSQSSTVLANVPSPDARNGILIF